MQQNNKGNQLSTVLLLITLGFLIYYLTKPKVANNNKTPTSTPTLTNGRVEKFAADEPTVTTSPAASATTSPAASATTSPAATPAASVTTSPAASASATSSANVLENQELVNQILSDENVQIDVKNFLPNDTADSGADLNSAFESPLPQKTSASSVDLNKNNVTKYDAKDFLPKEINDKWFDTDFSQAKYNVNDDKLINTERYVIGVNTVGQSLKNASYDIRGTVPNPKFTVSPWNNSTYEPDFNLKPLC